MEIKELHWTGERFLPWLSDKQADMALEHMCRYYLASEFGENKAILDVASGEGYGSYLLSNNAKSVLGVDVSEEVIEVANKKYQKNNLKYILGNATQLEKINQKFEVVTAFEMIEHIYEQEVFIDQVKKVLVEDGIFIVSTPNKYVHEHEYHSENHFHVKELYFDEFETLLNKNFKYCYFLGQRVYRTAESWCIESDANDCAHRSVEIDEVGVHEKDDKHREPSFYIAVCSDKPISKLKDRYYLTDISDCMLKYLNDRITVLEDPKYHYRNKASVYFDMGGGFSEELKTDFFYIYEENFNKIRFTVEVPAGTKAIRLDVADQRYCIVQNLDISPKQQNFKLISSNEKCRLDERIFFDTTDPQMIFSCEEISDKSYSLEISFEVAVHESLELVSFIENARQQLEGAIEKLVNKNQLLEDTMNKLNEKNKEEKKYRRQIRGLKAQLRELQSALADIRQQSLDKDVHIDMLLNTTSWKITKPLRVTGDVLKKTSDHIRIFHKVGTAGRILRTNGIKGIKDTINQKKINRNEMERIAAHSGLSIDELRKKNNKDGYLAIDSEYQEDEDYSGLKTDIKTLAFYLPQYHAFPENDKWWGKGFTEWVNVKQGEARFEGHYQPRVPHSDIGYYSLDDVNVLKKQAQLAKKHGIYGFCFYYYWFSGKRLMEKPVDMLLEHPEINLPFCLCWANENWTRAWDGQNKDILIAQDYSDEDDTNFMIDMKKYIDDSRYIKVNGKPVVIVYNPGQLPDCDKSFERWREVSREIGIGEILIWTCQTCNNTAEILGITDIIDAEVEFPPHNLWMENAAVKGIDLKGKSAFIYNYQVIANEMMARLKEDSTAPVPVHHGCMLAWDNAARRKDAWFTYYAYSAKCFYRWLTAIINRTRTDFQEEERFVFINAWNEWGEGTYLEPDEKYGYTNINTVSKALFGIPFNQDLTVIDEDAESIDKEAFEKKDQKARIAVQVHMFYLDTLKETIEHLNMIPFRYDCYFSTDSREKADKIEKALKGQCNCQSFAVEVFKNRGRDVAPFLVQMQEHINVYDYVCHIHSKKTKTEDHGNEWRSYIFKHLFGNSDYLSRIFHLFETNPDLGLIMPETYPVLELQAEWGGNREGVQLLLDDLGIRAELPAHPVFPVGNMFWAKTSAICKIFDASLDQEDFPKEAGQVNATLAHQIERAWVYIAKDAGFKYRKVFNNFKAGIKLADKQRLLAFVHFDRSDRLSNKDNTTLKIFSEFCDTILFVSNSKLSEEDQRKVAKYTNHILLRDNTGYDFGAWRDILKQYGRENAEKYDELILLNNSCLPPVFDIREMFFEMESKSLDFWGDKVSPYSSDGSYIQEKCIYEHLQSYFMVFENKVIKSDVFWKFWDEVQDYNSLKEVIAHCETKLTKRLGDAGFTYEPYIRESYYISRFLNNYAVPYEKPVSLLLLKDPLVKKKCYQYIGDEEKVKLEYLLDKLRGREKV